MLPPLLSPSRSTRRPSTGRGEGGARFGKKGSALIWKYLARSAGRVWEGESDNLY